MATAPDVSDFARRAERVAARRGGCNGNMFVVRSGCAGSTSAGCVGTRSGCNGFQVVQGAGCVGSRSGCQGNPTVATPAPPVAKMPAPPLVATAPPVVVTAPVFTVQTAPSVIRERVVMRAGGFFGRARRAMSQVFAAPVAVFARAGACGPNGCTIQ